MRLDSLAFRLFAITAAWTVIVLPIAGVIIYQVYRQEVQESFDERLKTLLLVVLADSVGPGGTVPGSPTNVGEPLFEITHSGWYWHITPVAPARGEPLVSASLATGFLVAPHALAVEADPQGLRWLNGIGPEEQRVRVVETLFTLGEDGSGARYSFRVAGPLEWLEARLSAFRVRLATALALSGLALLAATILQIRFGLSPLSAIGRELSAVRSGESSTLAGKFPVEIEPLQEELNALIKANQDVIERARTQVGNLAHALKTPLAVIANEAREDRSPAGPKIVEQTRIMGDQINLYLNRARMAARIGVVGSVTSVSDVAQPLKRALERIHRDRGIAIEVDCPTHVRFQGERQDLEEMLGNLLDNASKWASEHVRFRAELPEVTSGGRRWLVISIDDDGPGLTAEQRSRLGKRGLRLDETKPGSGLGLSIVRDLTQLYGGQLELAASDLGGLSARLRLPAI